MKPESIGRVLGIGVRVAGRIVGQRVAASVNAAASAPTAAVSTGTRRAAGREARRGTGSVARGVSGFLRPFGRVGGKIWLEVTGVFFFLPVLVFAPTLWRVRASYLHGPDHRMFLITAGVVLLFLYFGVSSFWRAWRK
jgi:hypothetical protein